MDSYEGADILALEAAAALEAGMSYGKWKAMGGKIEPGENTPLPNGWQTCKRCGKAFKPKRGCRQFYCNPECQYETQKERNRDRKREQARANRERLEAERKANEH